MKKRGRLRKGLAMLLTAAMMVGIIPAMSGGADEVQAATENGTGNTPSVTAYATKEQLMTAFAPDSDGNATNIGKLVFGKDENGTAQEWYILGKDEGVSGDNTILFAASPIATGQMFENDWEKKKTESSLWSDCDYSGVSITKVYSNHYGASDLRVALQGMATNTSYFTTAEQGMMNPTTVTTKDTNNSATYTTTDKLYALQGDFDNDNSLWAGTSDSTVLAMNSYWSSGAWFWLRSPCDSGDSIALFAIPGCYVNYQSVNYEYAVQPASNLNLSSVLFASAATAASSETAESGTIADGTAMTLRLDGTGKNIGLVTYNTTTGDIKAAKGSTSQTVALVVQGNDGANDWYYSKKIDASETVNASAIKSALGLSSDIDLSSCKIWLEITEDNVSYAVDAEKEIEKINTTYVTKEQLMNSFKPYSGGTAANYGKLVFGKNSSGTAQEWYILGKDEDVLGDNTIIFAASPIATNQVFENDYSNNKDFQSSFGVYASNPSEVYPNHYGASDLRVALQGMATNTSYFTTAEQGLMNATTVKTKDTNNNSVTYTTTDKLYALQGNYNDNKLWAGTSDSTVLAMSSYWSNCSRFWLRSPFDYSYSAALLAFPGVSGGFDGVSNEHAVQPVSNLNLSSVLFASAATAASSDTVESDTIASGTAMTLRLDGTVKNIGTAIYNAEEGTIEVRRGSTSQTVALIVQGNDGANDWYYSKKITASDTINVSAIVSETNTPSSIDLSTCKIWLEVTDTDGLAYAVSAEKEIEKINTTYVTKEQLMNSFKPYSDGTSTNIGKLVFGKDENGTAQEWYILGKDTGVTGDNTIIFAASPIATGQMFENDRKNIKTESSLWSDCDYSGVSITEVYPNHYGASDLRVALKSMATNTTYFTSAEQGLMNATTVTTKDTNNSATYTITDKLYALSADGVGFPCRTIKAGSGDSTVLAIDSYWSSGDRFWLRSPDVDYDNYAMYTIPGSSFDPDLVDIGYAVQPASNLNLSSVLFVSSAKAASSDAVSAGTITSGTAMTLRLDASATAAATAVGTVIYDASTGVIAAQKNADATGNVSLVVQGKGTIDETEQDWYYSVPVEGTIAVTKEQIQNKLSLSAAPDLAACQIWLETTIDNVAYASTAEAVETMQVKTVNSVAVTDVKPVGGEAFNTKASCNTEGIVTTTPAITYTTTGDNGEVEATGKADWNATYKAAFTLTTGIVNDVVYVFGDSVSVTIDGEAQSASLAPNVDGTLTVTRELTSAKRKIVSVAAPKVPTDNTFTTYYGFEGYADTPVSISSNELGNQATVTLESTDLVDSTTEDMNVTWTIANDGGAAYDRTPGAENIFRWTIPASEFPDYDASACQGYDAQTGDITGTVTITNKAATPVTIAGTDSGIAYTGATIDVSDYFDIDANAGTATYSLVAGENGGTGEGEISGTTLTVTKTGTFKIKVETLANGIYGAGEKTITLTVSNGTIEYTATDYSGTYDGQPHSISVNVTNPEGTIISYSTDGENYGSDNPSFTNAGNYTVYYRITKDNYNTISENSTVNVAKAASAPNKPESTMDVDYGKKKVSDITTLPEGWAWQDEDKGKALTVGTAVAATAVYTGADKGNYETESVEISITRLKCTHATTEVKGAKAATCTEKGYTGDNCCTVCGKVITAGTDINALGHNFADTFTTDKEATCTAKGVMTYTCDVCHETKTEDIAINPNNHAGETEVVGAVEATCKEDGFTGDTKCKDCGETLIPGTVIDKLTTHSYVNGVCSVCDDIFKTTVDGVTYQVMTETGADGKPVGKLVTVSGNDVPQVAVAVIGTGDDFAVSDGKVTVPSEITGSGSEQTFVVTKLSENAFNGASVTEVVVPATVTEVGTGAFGTASTITFKGNTAPSGIAGAITETVTTVNVPEGAADSYREELDENANIVEAHTHTFDTKWTYDETYHWHVATCGHAEEVSDKAVHTFGEWTVTKEATEDAEGVKTITCSVCGKTKTEVIPKKTATTQEPPKKSDVVKDDKTSVTVEVTDVAKKEVEYKEPDGKKAKTVSIPATVTISGVTYKVTKIADNAFKNNKTVTKVTVGSNIKTIGKNAFYKCTKLKTVKIGKNVTKIGANAFKGCKKLKTIKITSTKLTSKTVSKNAFKGLTKATTIKVPKKKLKAYKKLFKQKGLSSKVKVKGY